MILLGSMDSHPAGAVAAPEPVTRDQPLPLTFAQESLWFIDRLEKDSSRYNVPTALNLTGVLDTKALQSAISELIQRHESLRTTFVGEESPSQVVADRQTIEMIGIDVSNQTDSEVSEQLSRLATEPFDLSAGPLIRAYLLNKGDKDHILLIVVHHIVADGWSLGILMRDLAELYAGFLNQEPASLPELPLQFADYAVWQRQALEETTLDAEVAYWKQQLASAPALLELPLDRPRPSVSAFKGNWVNRSLPPDVLDSLRRLARNENATLYMSLLAAFNILLGRYTAQADIIVGTPVAGRSFRTLENLVGYFLNSLVLRNDLGGNPSYTELLGRIRETTLDAFENQNLPFEKLVEELQPERSLSYTPLFQILFNLQNREQELVPFEGLEVDPVVVLPGTSKYDLHLLLEERSDGLGIWFEYDTELFDGETIERMATHFETLLGSIVAQPESPISQLPWLAEAERNQLLLEWNDTRHHYDPEQSLHGLFQAQATQSPDAIAVSFEDTTLSYTQLDQKSSQLARHLGSMGIGPGSLAGIYIERSLDMMVAMLGVLKAGAAYVPLDPAFPKPRIEFMIDDAGLAVPADPGQSQ